MLMENTIILNTLYLVGILFKFMIGLLSSSKSIISQSTITIWTNIVLISALTINLFVDKVKPLFQVALTITILGLLWQLSIIYRHYDSINLNKVPSTYISWNIVYNLLLLMFIGVVVGAVANNKDNLLFILSILMFINIIINQIILDFFMVDIYTE